MKRTLSVILALTMIFSVFSILSIPASAAETEVTETGDTSGTTGDCTWSWNAGRNELTIAGNGYMADYGKNEERPWDAVLQGQNYYTLIINHDVKGIGKNAFANTPLTAINYAIEVGSLAYDRTHLDEGLQTINEYAFYGCDQLQYFYAPASLKHINCGAFENCSSLKLAQLSWGLESIESYAFCDCPELDSITVPTSVTRLSGNAYGVALDDTGSANFRDDFTVVCAPGSVAKTTRLICDTSLYTTDTDNGTSSFDPDTGILTVDCNESNDPQNGGVWGGNAYEFYMAYWGEIKAIQLGPNVFHIGPSAFDNLVNVETVTINNGCRTIAEYAFSGCMNLSKLNLFQSRYSAKIQSIGEEAFYDCPKISQVEVPATLTHISEKAFGYYFYGDSGNGKVDSLTMMALAGESCREAKRYCDENGFTYIEWTENPEITKITNVRNGVQLTWTKSASAPLTTVFRVNGTTITPIGTTDKTSFVDNNVQSGKKYTYCVQCFAEDGITTVSNPSDSASITWYSAPELIGVQNVYNGQKIMWRASTGTTWNDNKNLKSGVTYYYTVIARDKDKNRAAYNTNTKIKFVVAPTNIKAANAIGGIQVSWTGSKGANYYIVYRCTYNGRRYSNWSPIATTKASVTKYLDTKVSKGTTYQYTVRAADRVRNADGTYRYQATSAFRTNSNKITRNR